MPAEITLDGLRSGLEPEIAAAARRPSGTRAGDRGQRLSARRRRGDAHRIVASILAVLALMGCGMAILMLAIEPAASRMQGDIASLRTRLGATASQLSALQTTTMHAARQESRLTQSIGLLSRHMNGLQRTIHGLQGRSTAAGDVTDGLRACIAALQQELGGLTLRTRSVHGHVTTVGLSDTGGAAGACGAVVNGG
ncbi:MAG: hypothetical protein WAU75_06745 [Solirubrobacteraceae bacterium]